MSPHQVGRNGSLPDVVSSHIQLLPKIPGYRPEPPTLVSVSCLIPAESPRLKGVDAAHAEMLAEVGGELPPILVQRSTMRVIDGMHRLNAALSRNQEKIYVQFFDCSEDEAFLLAVAVNVKHGLPLTLADRRAAAARIISTRPEASDRWIADIAGLSAKTVAAIRQTSADPVPRLGRIGRDGRMRPVNMAERRRTASAILASDPDTSLHRLARDAGISIATARDVREKIRRGLDPVTPARRLPHRSADIGLGRSGKTNGEVDVDSILQRLRKDPSVRYAESGRGFLRWLSPPRLIRSSDWEDVLDYIPPHCTFDVARVARSCALVWDAFAEELDRRSQDCG